MRINVNKQYFEIKRFFTKENARNESSFPFIISGSFLRRITEPLFLTNALLKFKNLRKAKLTINTNRDIELSELSEGNFKTFIS